MFISLFVADMIQQLKKDRENLDNEKAENRETIRMLEARLKQMTSVIFITHGFL